MVLPGNRYTWLDFAPVGTRANTAPAHNGAGNSLTTGSGTAIYSALAWHRLAVLADAVSSALDKGCARNAA
jgi:hypothetical protein